MYLSLRSKQPADGLSLRSMQHAPPNIIFIYKVVVDCNFKKEFQVPWTNQCIFLYKITQIYMKKRDFHKILTQVTSNFTVPAVFEWMNLIMEAVVERNR
jgi:hypothetical protein